MRKSTKTKRIRILLVTACVLLFGSALAASATPAHAAANVVVVTSPGNQVTNPLSTAVDVPVSATDSDPTALLTFTMTAVPGLAISQPAGAGNATVAITGTITTPLAATDVTVTASDASGVRTP